MKELLSAVDHALKQNESMAIATVVNTWGSAPRPLGSKMLITSSGHMEGSVSGGCVEGAVFEVAQGVLNDGQAKRADFGVDDETAWSVGLSCGGKIQVLVEPLHLGADTEEGSAEIHRQMIDAVRHDRPAARAVLVGGQGSGRCRLMFPEGSDRRTAVGSLGSEDLNRRAESMVAEQWLSFQARLEGLSTSEGTEQPAEDIFVEIFAPPPKLIIVGAVHAAIALVTLARTVGFETVVIDPRTAFATEERFGHADRFLHSWPDEGLRDVGVNANTFVALLSHDMKLDIPALKEALPKARYVGALGSRKTQAKRLAAARDAGIEEGLLERIHNPIGLNLGGRRAEEIAVAVMAELVAVSHGIDAKPLPRAPEAGA